MRRALPVLLICALTPLAAGCGAGDDVKNAVDPVAQAATKTANAGTVEVAMTGKVSAAGQEIPLDGAGTFDIKGKRGHLTMTTAVPGQGKLQVEEIMDGLVIYMRSDALAPALHGKKWLKLDLQTAGKQAGVDIAQLQQLSGGGDPTQFLTYLAKAGDVHKVGSEDVNGTPTTHYHATIDFDKLAASAGGKAADSVRQVEKITGQSRLPTDIWIDSSQRVRRQTVTLEAQQPVPLKFALTIDYKRFGVPVDVKAPPAGETVDYADVATGG